MRPESGTSWPLSCAISVVLPAPFGPITACSSPADMPKVRSSVATMPPKRLARLSTSNRSAMAHLAEKAVDAATREQYDQQQKRAQDDLPIFSNTGEHLLQHQQCRRSEQRPEH